MLAAPTADARGHRHVDLVQSWVEQDAAEVGHLCQLASDRDLRRNYRSGVSSSAIDDQRFARDGRVRQERQADSWGRAEPLPRPFRRRIARGERRRSAAVSAIVPAIGIRRRWIYCCGSCPAMVLVMVHWSLAFLRRASSCRSAALRMVLLRRAGSYAFDGSRYLFGQTLTVIAGGRQNLCLLCAGSCLGLPLCLSASRLRAFCRSTGAGGYSQVLKVFDVAQNYHFVALDVKKCTVDDLFKVGLIAAGDEAQSLFRNAPEFSASPPESHVFA